MKNILIDTDVLIHFLRGVEKAKDFLVSAAEDNIVSCSSMTVAEIYAGMRTHEEERTAELVDSLNIINVTREIAEKAGKYKASIKKQNLELDDCILAATAFSLNAILVTGNGKHYPMTDIEKMIVSL